MIVEAGLADPDTSWMRRKGDDLGCRDLGFLGGVMGMRADREENVVMPGRDRLQRGVAANPRRDREKTADTRRARPRQNPGLVGRKIGKIEMAMAVDEHYGAAELSSGST